MVIIYKKTLEKKRADDVTPNSAVLDLVRGCFCLCKQFQPVRNVSFYVCQQDSAVLVKMRHDKVLP